MPKQPLTFNSFEKGIDSASDARDLKRGFVVDCVNMMVDEVGIVRTMGGVENHDAQGATNQPTVTIEAGRGLYAFSHDRLGAEDAGSAEAETADDYLAIADTGGDANIHIWSKEQDAWGVSAVIDLGSTTGMKPTYTSFDGGIRVSDGNFGAANKTKLYSYIDRKKFNTAYTDDGWFSKDNDLAPPPTGTFNANQVFASGDAGDAGKVNVSIVVSEDSDRPESEWQKEWEGGVSYVYDGTQETLLRVLTGVIDLTPKSGTHDNSVESATVMTDTDVTFIVDALIGLTINNTTDGSSGTITDNSATTVTVASLSGGSDDSWDDADEYTITGNNVSTARFQLQIFSASADRCNERLTHVKTYIRERGTQEWFIQGVWDLQEGGRLINGDTYDTWSALTAGSDDSFTAYNTAGEQPIPQILHTWESETGLFNDEKSIDVGQVGDGYQCSVVIGRTVYIGNVKRTNFNGEVQQEADAIYKSIPDQPDCFPASWRIDAAINDGEGITALHKWGKDLLQFKHRTLYIIDTSGETEILKSTFKKAGARNLGIITETPHGIVWANEWGLWLYNGELQNLLSQDTLGNEFIETQTMSGGLIGLGTIEQATWSTFLNSSSYLGYFAYKQQIIIGDNYTASGAGNIYIYDFRTDSMVRGLAKFTASQKHTNFVTDSNDDLLIAHTTGTILKWGDTSTASSNQELVLPEVGKLGLKMKVYKVHASYKSSAAQATPLYYRANGNSSWTAFGTQSFSDTGDGSTESFQDITFDLTATPVECMTIQFKLDLPSSGIVEINDVTLRLRQLTVKPVG